MSVVKKRHRLTNLEVLEVSLVPRGANRKRFLVAKAHDGPDFSEPRFTEEQEQFLAIVEAAVEKNLEIIENLAKEDPLMVARRRKLRKEPLCESCKAAKATEVAPIDPSGRLFDLANLQSLCKGCFIAQERRRKGITKMDDIETWRLTAIRMAERGEVTLRKSAWDRIEKGAKDLMKEKGFDYPDALCDFMGTPEGQEAYELYNQGAGMGEPSEIEQPVAKEEPETDASKELSEKIGQLVEKADPPLSYDEAFERVCKQNPELYRRWRESVIVISVKNLD